MTIQSTKLAFECTSDEFRVAVTGCGVKVEISADGKVTVFSRLETRQLEPDLKMSASEGALKIGAKMPDGTIYAGVSPDTGKSIYATPKDGPFALTFGQAAKYASKLDANGRLDWRVPTKAELNVLFQNRAAVGGFDTSGSDPDGWYWSSSHYGIDSAWSQRFSAGNQIVTGTNLQSALRCVRG